MVSRRLLLVGGLASVAGGCGGRSAGRADDPTGPAGSTSSAAPPATTPPATTPPAPPSTALPTPTPTPASIPDPERPLVVDWIGGSDVVLDDRSLPAAVARRLPGFEDRPLVIRARTGLAVMATDAGALVAEALAAGTDALVISINPVWLHWDESSCEDIEDRHERYRCLLSPTSSAVSAQRAQDLAGLVRQAVDSGLPVYAYTQPHSTDSLDDPSLAPLIADAEATIAAFEPGDANVRLVSRVFTRDLPPMYEGAEFDFIDMVHPTVAGVEKLADHLATDLVAFWRVTTPSI